MAKEETVKFTLKREDMRLLSETEAETVLGLAGIVATEGFWTEIVFQLPVPVWQELLKVVASAEFRRLLERKSGLILDIPEVDPSQARHISTLDLLSTYEKLTQKYSGLMFHGVNMIMRVMSQWGRSPEGDQSFGLNAKIVELIILAEDKEEFLEQARKADIWVRNGNKFEQIEKNTRRNRGIPDHVRRMPDIKPLTDLGFLGPDAFHKLKFLIHHTILGVEE